MTGGPGTAWPGNVLGVPIPSDWRRVRCEACGDWGCALHGGHVGERCACWPCDVCGDLSDELDREGRCPACQEG